MKKLLFALAALALVILLTPMQEARADYHDGDKCPQCSTNSITIYSADDDCHTVECWNCGFTTTEPHFGGKATCTQYAECEVCGCQYRGPLGHVWEADATQGIRGWTWNSDYSEYTLHLKCSRQGCSETRAVKASTTFVGPKSYDETSGKVNYYVNVDFTDDVDGTVVDVYENLQMSVDPIEVNCVYLVAGVYYLNLPDRVPESYDCHYEMTYWEGPVEFNQVVEINGEYYLAANVDTMLYRAISTFFSKVAGFPATCTADGQEDYWECLSCHRMYSDKDAKNEIQEPVAIPGGHVLEETKKLEPTCEEPGHEAYWTCQRDGCGKMFSDKDGENEIEAPAVIKALGHDWVLDTTKGNSGWDWDIRLGEYSATAYLKCDRDGCKETATAVDNALQRSAPTYNPDTEQAEIEYTATVTKDGKTFSGNTTVSDNISERWIVVQFVGGYALVGDFDQGLEEVMQDGEENVTVDQTINCHDVFIGWSDPVFSYYRAEIAAEEAILYIYYSTTPQYQASGLTHMPEAPATCEEDGAEEYWTCENCGKKYSDAEGKNEIKAPAAIGKLGHDLTHHDAQAATCTEIGWEEYDTCSRCDYTTYAEIPALGHKYQITSRTITVITYMCVRCGDSAWGYNPGSRSMLEGLVRDGGGTPVEYDAGVSRVDEKWTLTVTPDPESRDGLTDTLGLYLKPDDVKQWLREGVAAVRFQREGAALLIELKEIVPDWFPLAENEEIDCFAFTLAPDAGGMLVQADALIGEEKRPADAFKGVTLKTEGNAWDATHNGVYPLD